jgi:hypothetical protein
VAAAPPSGDSGDNIDVPVSPSQRTCQLGDAAACTQQILSRP